MAEGVSRPPAGDAAPRAARPKGDAPAEADSLEGVPAMLGEFRLLRRLGKGGMAEVFLAEQTSLQRNVAIKILRNENVTDEIHLKRFKAEAMAAGGLSHPNIVQVYMIGEQQGMHYIAQEYVAGQNLRDFITRKGPPELNVALHIMRQVASALQVAGDAGIVHRDIKPENILLTRKGEVKVADFGLAQLTLGGERLNLTRENTTLGTPLYMSPEQVNGSKLDLRSDLYSFGVTCYHMLTGSPPFRGETAIQVAVQHIRDEPAPLESLRTDLPPQLCRIVGKMMAKRVEDRYQTAQAILRDLKRLKQEIGAAEDEPAEEPAAAQRPAATLSERFVRGLDRPLLRQLGWFLGLFVLVAGAAAGLGWLARTQNPFEKPATARPAEIEKQETVLKQFLHAMANPESEAEWQAVVEHFPQDKMFVQRAQEKLALLYLTRGKNEQAEALFKEFSLAGDSDALKRAFGNAGLAFLATRNNQYEESQKLLDTVRPEIPRLNARMQELVRETVRRNREHGSIQFNQEWEKLLESPESPAGREERP